MATGRVRGRDHFYARRPRPLLQHAHLTSSNQADVMLNLEVPFRAGFSSAKQTSLYRRPCTILIASQRKNSHCTTTRRPDALVRAYVKKNISPGGDVSMSGTAGSRTSTSSDGFACVDDQGYWMECIKAIDKWVRGVATLKCF